MAPRTTLWHWEPGLQNGNRGCTQGDQQRSLPHLWVRHSISNRSRGVSHKPPGKSAAGSCVGGEYIGGGRSSTRWDVSTAAQCRSGQEGGWPTVGAPTPHGTACPSRCPALTLHRSQISVRWVLPAGGCAPLSGRRAGTRAAALPPGHPLLPAAGPAPRYSLTCTQQGTERSVTLPNWWFGGSRVQKSRHSFRAGDAPTTPPSAPCSAPQLNALQTSPKHCKALPPLLSPKVE